jgi:hypothetical protein
MPQVTIRQQINSREIIRGRLNLSDPVFDLAETGDMQNSGNGG